MTTEGQPDQTMLITLQGRPFASRSLERGEGVHLHITDENGESVSDGFGVVLAVTHKDVIDKATGQVVRTERIHSVKVS